MTWGRGNIGKTVDFAAAAVFAGAVAFALAMLASGPVAALIAPLAFLAAYCGLGRVNAQPLHAIAQFAPAPIDVPQPAAEESAREAADNNVVRLFDQRQLSIARPAAASPGGVPEDAGQALSDALAQLKRSLR